MLAELTIRNASLLDRAAPIGTRISELQPTSTRCVVVFLYVIIMVCDFTHQKNNIHTRAMTTPSMLPELTIRNASLLDRAALIRMDVFELQPTPTDLKKNTHTHKQKQKSFSFDFLIQGLCILIYTSHSDRLDAVLDAQVPELKVRTLARMIFLLYVA